MDVDSRLDKAGQITRDAFDGVHAPPIKVPMRLWLKVLVTALTVIAIGAPAVWLAGLVFGGADGSRLDPTTLQPPEPSPTALTPSSPPSTVIDTPGTDTTVATAQTIAPVRVEESGDGVWAIYEFDVLEPRLGMSAVMTDSDRLFLWGGAREGVGTVYNNGALLDISTGSVSLVPAAPIEGRLTATAVWTGTEFIVFGGQDFQRRFADGAAYDPATMTWRLLAAAPLSPAPFATATWLLDAMYVWLPSRDAGYAQLPSPSAGQFARYRPDTDTWQLLPAPPIWGRTARLLEVDGRPLLVTGPQMLDYGTPTPMSIPITAVAYDSARDLWLAPVFSDHRSDAAAAAVVGSSVVVLLADGPVITLSDGAWTHTSSVASDCPLGVNAAAADDRAYFVLCGGLFVGQLEDLRPLPLPDSLTDPQRYLITCCGGVLEATDDGTLALLGWEGPAGTGQPFRVNILVIYSPR